MRPFRHSFKANNQQQSTRLLLAANRAVHEEETVRRIMANNAQVFLLKNTCQQAKLLLAKE